MQTISAIVPVYNEEKSVSHVLNTLVISNLFQEVICVNDGSTDLSLGEIQKVKGVICIDLQSNKGKGYALATGVEQAKTDLVLFIDADLSSLSVDHLQKMINAFNEDKSIFGEIAYEKGEYLLLFSGQRIYPRKELLVHLDDMKNAKTGVEVFLNSIFKDNNIIHVELNGMGHLEKYKKYDKKTALIRASDQWLNIVPRSVIKHGMSWSQAKNILAEFPKYAVAKIKEYRKFK